MVHLKDLPVFGFNGDTKVGLGLWKRGRLAFVVEYLFYAIVSESLSGFSMIYALIIAGAFHLVNANSFFGSSQRNPMKS